jgi:predicted ATPase/DNA-binding SARP family transcriptional activator
VRGVALRLGVRCHTCVVEIGVLGPLQLLADDGTSVTPVSRYQRLLLGTLVATVGRVVPVDELAESLWGDRQPTHPGAALQSQVSRLRTRLGPAGPSIVWTPSGYRLEAPVERIDAVRFERCLRRIREAPDEPEVLLARLDRALGLWRGPAFADLDDPLVIAPEAARLEELRAAATELRGETLLRLGRAADAAAAMRALTRAQPFRERPVALLVRALVWDGRPADAAAEFERFRRLLADELGLPPSPALRALERTVLGAGSCPRQAPAIGEPGNSFVGRDREVAAAGRLLRSNRLVTLTGPGGVGKSRLAARVALRAADACPDGVHLCELAGVPEPTLVVAAVASTLGVDPRSGRSLTDRVVDHLQARRSLLVIDNCEHVLDGAAELVSALLRRTSSVRVLATSRERLAVEGEQRLPIGPLSVSQVNDGTSPAVVLFLDRMRDLRADPGSRDADSSAAVTALCRRLGGLPLAIELAAAQTLWRSTPEILADVSDRLDGLVDPRRPVARHRSLDAVFDWSSDSLEPPERDVFERLAVFSGGCTASAAATVASATGAQLATLVERSLVTARQHAAGTRYGLLEPVRQYAGARLERRGGAAELRHRHAAWAIGLAETACTGLCGPREARWRAVLEAEVANLRAAHSWTVGARPDLACRLAAALYRWTWGGAPAEVYGWAEQVITRHPDAGPAAYAAAALGSWHRGDLARAHDLAAAGLTRVTGDPAGARLAWEALGDVECFRGRFDDSIAAFGRALELARAAGDRFDEAVALHDRALGLAYAGRIADALADCRAAAPLVDAVANPSLSAWHDYADGEVRLESAPVEALPFLRRGLTGARRAGNRLLVGVAGLSAVSCGARVGDPAAALLQYAEVIDHWRRHGARNMQWATVRTFVELLARMGRDDDAARLYGAMSASASAPPLAGADATRISEALDSLRRRLGQARLARLCTEGAGLSDDKALDHALACCVSSRLDNDPARWPVTVT